MLLMLKSVLKQRVNIQFCILNESSAIRKESGPHDPGISTGKAPSVYASGDNE